MKLDHIAHNALVDGLQELERVRVERARREAEDREWPGIVVEDVLDCGTVVEPTRITSNPIIGIDKIV